MGSSHAAQPEGLDVPDATPGTGFACPNLTAFCGTLVVATGTSPWSSNSPTSETAPAQPGCRTWSRPAPSTRSPLALWQTCSPTRSNQRLADLFTTDAHVEDEATWGIYQRMIAGYREPDRTRGRELMQRLIDSSATTARRDVGARPYFQTLYYASTLVIRRASAFSGHPVRPYPTVSNDW